MARPRSKFNLEEALRLSEQGLSNSAISRILGTSTMTVQRRLKEAGTISHMTNVTDERRTSLVDAYLSGKSMAAVAKEFNCSPTTVKNACHKAGITTRPTGTNQTKDPMKPEVQRLVANIRSRTRQALNLFRAEKAYANHEMFGMTYGQWLDTQPIELVEAFMNGEAVHVDEIRPCSSFDLTDPAQQAVCFNWRNRQLLLATDNLTKNNKWNRAEWETMMRAKGWKGELF